MEARLPKIVLFAFFACLGGANACIAQTLTTIANLSAPTTGTNPGPLVVGPDGSIYGVSIFGGPFQGGALFKLNPPGAPSKLYGFCFQAGCTDGQYPAGGLISGTDGYLYGTTQSGGAYNHGAIFRISPTGGSPAVLYSFCQQSACPDGANPIATLLQGSGGIFYGTTLEGGANGSGTIFSIDSSANFNTLYSFCAQSACSDGGFPGGLVLGSDGALYGTTQSGGAHSAGSVFQFTIGAGTPLTTLYSFCSELGCADGAYPSASSHLTFDAGVIYGMTTQGGFNDSGTLFKMTTTGRIATLYSFCSRTVCADGSDPVGSLLLGSNGNFYGTTRGGGGPGSYGTLFQMTPSGILTTLYQFCSSGVDSSCPDGIYPGELLQTSNGMIYGATAGGGDANNDGTIFRLSLGPPARAALGAKVDYLGTGAADFSVFRPSSGYFYSLDQADFSSARQWGLSTDIPVTGDYDGDGKTDIAVYRPSSGMWYIILSSNNQVMSKQFGLPTDIPVVGDFDGDGKTDIAVYRPSTGTWYISQSSTNQMVQQQFGVSTDIPVVGDFDGDGKTDIAVYRPSTGYWYILASDTHEMVSHQWGAPGDIPAPGYYDADAMTDIAVYRPSTGMWYIVQSSTGQIVSTQFGQSGDVPVPQDYDGDGKTDVAVYRPSTGVWYFLQSSSGELVGRQWGGQAGDIPLNTPAH